MDFTSSPDPLGIIRSMLFEFSIFNKSPIASLVETLFEVNKKNY
jgi:hypothetical protein